MTRRMKALAAALLAVLLAGSALAEGGEIWSADREIRCAEDLPGCRLLQMVMMGSFDAVDPEDALMERVLAGAYPLLSEVGEADIAHFAAEFGEDEDATRERFYAALANCLRAQIEAEALPEARLAAARRVLLLFLDPGDAADAESQREQIRQELTEAALERLADAVGAPVDFVRWLTEARED